MARAGDPAAGPDLSAHDGAPLLGRVVGIHHRRPPPSENSPDTSTYMRVMEAGRSGSVRCYLADRAAMGFREGAPPRVHFDVRGGFRETDRERFDPWCLALGAVRARPRHGGV